MPNCLCYTTPETVSEEEFLKQYQAGAYNDYLDEVLPDYVPGPPITPTPTVPTPPVPTPKPVMPEPAPITTPAPQLASPGKELPYKRLPEPEGYFLQSAKKTNPGEGHASKNFNYNCHYVTSAMEMRARGYDVIASPTFLKTGRFNDSIARDWIDPKTGASREFKNVPTGFGAEAQHKAVVQATEDWPNGARGYVSGAWIGKKGAHIFNVYKDELGEIRYAEGQVPVHPSKEFTNINNMTRIKILRVDDLQPIAARIDRAVNEGAPLKVGFKQVKLDRLQVLIDSLSEGIAENPNSNERMWMAIRRTKAVLARDKILYPPIK